MNGSAAAYARNVEPGGLSILKFPSDKAAENGDNNGDGKELDKYDTHDPDATFYYTNTYWPLVVIEVSYSQKRKALKDFAENYILGSDGNISVMTGLDRKTLVPGTKKRKRPKTPPEEIKQLY